MSRVFKLHEVTLKLYDLVQREISVDEREQTVDNINDLLEQRDEQLKFLQGPYSDEEKRLGREIIHMDQVINGKVNDLLKQVKRSIALTQKQKSTNQKYTNLYQNASNYDGMFVDRKN